MKIFVGYHYGSGSEWVEDHVYRLVRAFGDEVESGRIAFDAPSIPDVVKGKIENSDALIGVCNRDVKAANGFYTTHPWAKDELTIAKASGKYFVQLREQGVDPRQGFLEGAQYIEYETTQLAECIVKLAEAIGQWHALRNVKLYLVPTAFVDALGRVLTSRALSCRYFLYDADYNLKYEGAAQIVPARGSPCIPLRRVPKNSLVRIEVSWGNETWTSEAEAIDSPAITMRRM